MTKEEMKNENISDGKREELFLDIDDVNMIDLYLNSFDETLLTGEHPHFTGTVCEWDSK